MIKVRLSGLLHEIEKTSEIIKKHFNILNESDIYSNKNSEYKRKYFEMEIKENEEEHKERNK